jgi:hypothetical protein
MRLRFAVALLVLGSSSASGQELAQRKTLALPHVLEAVGQAIDMPMPAGLSAADQQAYAAHTEWLKSVRRRVEVLKSNVAAPADAAGEQSSEKRQHGAITITKQWERLQATIEEESRKFNTLSNASKARHDIAMNAIRNMKA